MSRCKAPEIPRNEAYDVSGSRSEARGSRKNKYESIITFDLVPCALRLSYSPQ